MLFLENPWETRHSSSGAILYSKERYKRTKHTRKVLLKMKKYFPEMLVHSKQDEGGGTGGNMEGTNPFQSSVIPATSHKVFLFSNQVKMYCYSY